MKICDSVIMLMNISPDRHRMIMPAIKRPIHKFHLRYFLVDKKLKFFFYELYLPET